MILKISVRLLKHLTSRRMTLLLGRPDSEKSTLLLALADKNLKLTEFAKPKPTELFRVSSVRPTTCLGEHQQTATWYLVSVISHTYRFPLSNFLGILGEVNAVMSTINDRSQRAQHDCLISSGYSPYSYVCLLRLNIIAFFHGCNPLCQYRSVLATSINPKIFGGRLFLSSTSGTHIYFDTETALGKEKSDNLKDLKAFAEAIDVVRDKGVAMAVAVAVAMAMASAEDIDATVHVQKFSEVKKAL
ncbi:hypothetical protein HID58_041588 [Brassica napus]|uniref:Uncharacterized protein n=1 Tax=Brassica napus TaxID=3708 RepID=A0ABQ8BB87_BRANA|nr:hypothetical protein HID58_041588 [Brassica napus]